MKLNPARLAASLIHRLKNVDGIDEAAASMALIRGITGPALAEAVFVGGFPFVVFGLMGMREESAEVKIELAALFEDRADLVDQINQLMDQTSTPAGSSRRSVKAKLKELAKSLQSHIQQLQTQDPDLAAAKAQKASVLLAKLGGLDRTQSQQLTERIAAPFGKAAMTGMTVGMLPGMAWGAAEITARSLNQTTPAVVQQFAGAPLAAQVAGASGAAVSMAFAPANAAMVGYATLKAVAGHQRCSQLLAQKALIESHQAEQLHQNRADETVAERLDKQSASRLTSQHIGAEMRASRRTQGVYGAVTAVSQSALTASGAVSIAAFAGSAAAASIGTAGIVIPITGAAGAIAAAGLRIRGEIEQETRRGDDSAPPIRSRPNLSPPIDAEGRVADAAGQLYNAASAELINASRSLAADKITSLALKAIDQYDTPAQRMQAMIQWVAVNGGKTGSTWGKGTTLLPETVEHMRMTFYTPETQSRLENAFDQMDRGAARRQLLAQSSGGESVHNLIQALAAAGQTEPFMQKLTQALLEVSPEAIRDSDPGATDSSAMSRGRAGQVSLRAQDKLLSIFFKAHSQSPDPVIRSRLIAKAVKQTQMGWKTQMARADRQQLGDLYKALSHKVAYSQPSVIEKLARLPSGSDLMDQLKVQGFGEAQIAAAARRSGFDLQPSRSAGSVAPPNSDQSDAASSSGSDEAMAVSNEVVVGAGPFGLLHHQEDKQHFELDVERLATAAQDSDWLNSKIHEIAVPLLSKASKNDSKVRFQQAFNGMVLGAESTRQSKVLLNR